ncbi:hypothetical protein [Bizionia paragorgiae]|uniref:hypothetical protein n=1 Tax=Bizionia paragorgiae TaxID=283786 RepID=UPI003A8DDCB8
MTSIWFNLWLCKSPEVLIIEIVLDTFYVPLHSTKNTRTDNEENEVTSSGSEEARGWRLEARGWNLEVLVTR